MLPSPVSVATADGTALNVVADPPSDRPVLLLTHALGASTRMWEAQMAALSGDFRVVRYDHRGHGASGLSRSPVTIDLLGRDALAVLDSVGATTAVYCGLSMGGLLGLWLAANAPDRIRRVVCADALARVGSRQMWEDRIAAVSRDGVASLADATMGRWFTAAFREAQPDVVAGIRAMFVATPQAGYAAICEALRDADLNPIVSGIRVPLLLVTGEHDPLAPPAGVQSLASRIPGARAEVITATAHLPNVEQPEVFSRIVGEFLRGPL